MSDDDLRYMTEAEVQFYRAVLAASATKAQEAARKAGVQVDARVLEIKLAARDEEIARLKEALLELIIWIEAMSERKK